MSKLRYSLVLVLLVVALGDWIRATGASSISGIVGGYADAFTTLRPSAVNRQQPVRNYADYSVDNPGWAGPGHLGSGEPNGAPSSNIHHSVYKGDVDASTSEETSGEDPKGPPDHVIPFSEHENPREPPTRPKYSAPGGWAKPSPQRNVPLEFVPTKLYAQVRGTHTVKHVPRKEAIENAETDEEKESAARLKEVVKVSKANTIYTEEGYEDAAYDHAGHIRDADFHEGFARKLNEEEHEENGGKASGESKKKPRKYEATTESLEDYSDHTEASVESREPRVAKQKVSPESLKILKNALNKPVIDPKIVAEKGIHDLEDDLREESLENERTSTVPYYDTTTYRPPVTESPGTNDVEYETTTMRQIVYTVRPRRPTAKPKTHTSTRRPLRYFKISNDSPPKQPTTPKPTSPYQQYYDYNPNQLTGATYKPEYFNPPTISPLSTNPMGIATINGHGHYLMLGYTQSPIDRKIMDSSVFNSQAENLSSEGGSSDDTSEYQNDDPTLHSMEENSLEDTELRFPKAKVTPGYVKMLDYLKGEKGNYYTVSKPLRSRQPLVTYPDYPRRPYGNNVLGQWSVKPESERPVESVYDVMNAAERTKKMPLPVAGLLPPAPLSNSEYASFSPRDRRVDHVIPAQAMALIPIIDAIHRYENKIKKQQRPLSFLFRGKRSTEPGRTREWEILQRDKVMRAKSGNLTACDSGPEKSESDRSDEIESKAPKKLSFQTALLAEKELGDAIKPAKKDQQTRTSKIRSRARSKVPPAVVEKELDKKFNYQSAEYFTSDDGDGASVRKKPPKSFHQLLNEAPDVAAEHIDEQIKSRFQESTSKEEPHAEKLVQSSTEALGKTEKEQSEEEEEENSSDVREAKNSLEITVPEINFSDVFEEDEVEPAARKATVDTKKYPYYKNSEVKEDTVLKYIINPLDVPQKTLGGMEFYESRNLGCEDVDPDLEKLVPEEEELANKRGARKGKPRLNGLGDKLDCYKAKYFDENPLDNPLFLEETIKAPAVPAELDPKRFSSRILHLPTQVDEYVVPQGPKAPENLNTNARRDVLSIPKQRTADKSSNARARKTKQNTRHNKNRGSAGDATNEKVKIHNVRGRTNRKKPPVPMYQRQVYEDVMGTIKNMDNMHKPSPPKYGRVPVFRYSVEQESGEIFVPSKRRPVEIDGLVPPPAQFGLQPRVRPKMRHSRHNRHEGNIKNFRMFKRSVDSASTSDENRSTEKIPFRIIYTTPPVSEKRKRKRKTVTQEPEITTAASVTLTTTPVSTDYKINYKKHAPGSEAEIKRYDKFLENQTESVDVRRKEPRYNYATKNTSKDESPGSSEKSVKLEETATSTDSSISRSTWLPVAVRPDANLTPLYAEAFKIKHKEQQGKGGQPKKKDAYNIADVDGEYRVHETIEDDYEDAPIWIEGIDETTEAPDYKTVHKELLDFLEGDPPGYAKVFGNETTPSSNDSQSKESQEKAEIKSDKSSDQELDKSDVNTEVNSTESAEDEGTTKPYSENRRSDEDEGTTKSYSDNRRSDEEPFVRYSDRPYSPPENYEDDRYADLGPRVNKPYFHHPSFEVPEYEKHNLGKNATTNDDEWDHTEETVDHEKYVFPWENEEDDEDSEEEASSSRYEFPWERRERKEKEKERLRKKYYEDDEDEDATDASSSKLVYVPLKKKHTRGKKDVNSLESSPDRRSSKFSSKYKSGVVKIPTEDEELFITVANNDAIKQSIMDYLETTVLNPELKNKTSNLRSRNSTSKPETTSSIQTTTLKPTTTTVVSSTTPTSTKIRIRSRKPVKPTEASTTTAPKKIRRRGRNMENTSSTSTTTTPSTISSTIRPNSRRRGRPTSTTPSTRVSSTTSRTISERRWRQPRARNSPRSGTSNHTTSPSLPTSTGRMTEHHSRVSKEEIITKTFYPDEDESDEDERDSKADSSKAASSGSPVVSRNAKTKRRTKSDSQEEQSKPKQHTKKKEKVEKVTITMEETPDHVYETKEIDKDGVKGKFVTITANNNGSSPEIGRKISKFDSFDSELRDTEDASGENYKIGKLLQQSPLPAPRNSNDDETSQESEETEENDESGSEEDDSEETKSVTPRIIKDPSSRRYYYVERR